MSVGLSIAIVGVTFSALAFVFGVVKLKSNERLVNNGNSGKYVLQKSCDRVHTELVTEVHGIRDSIINQGQTLARVDERTLMLAKKNGVEK